YIPGHTSKGGKWIPGHQSKKKKSPGEVQDEMTSKGYHREHRYYPGHYAADGHYVKPHREWVWVKDDN
ncbi:MAG TPA: hypothetical protein VMI31_12635, partial [Fimbriimonadaceae bacterium]|nr:hypothetical protein [Fimbriimonadaceae bacterium]